MKCQICKFEYPVSLLSWMITSDGYKSLCCGICVLNETNKIYGTNKTYFNRQDAENKRQEALKYRHKTATYYVHKNSGNTLFVKDKEFFEEQGGVYAKWGEAWVPVVAKTIGDARRKAAVLFDVPLSPIHKDER